MVLILNCDLSFVEVGTFNGWVVLDPGEDQAMSNFWDLFIDKHYTYILII